MLLQAESCLRLEEERVDSYLHASTKPKLLREVETEVLQKYEQDLLQKEHSGCAALLRDDKVRAGGRGGGAGWWVLLQVSGGFVVRGVSIVCGLAHSGSFKLEDTNGRSGRLRRRKGLL